MDVHPPPKTYPWNGWVFLFVVDSKNPGDVTQNNIQSKQIPLTFLGKKVFIFLYFSITDHSKVPCSRNGKTTRIQGNSIGYPDI